MSQSKPKFVCSNCGKEFHGLTACNPWAGIAPEELRKEIDDHGSGAYFDSQFATWVARNFEVPSDTALKMIQAEADSMIRDEVEKGRGKEGRAQARACRSILDWLLTTKEYQVDWGDLKDVARFVASHRTACVWSVMVGRAALRHTPVYREEHPSVLPSSLPELSGGVIGQEIK